MKTIAVVALATLSTAFGEALLSIGMKQVGDISALQMNELWKILYMFGNMRVVGGIFFMALFFFLYSAAFFHLPVRTITMVSVRAIFKMLFFRLPV